jgi:glycerol-3-phosphate O-acyltransferase
MAHDGLKTAIDRDVEDVFADRLLQAAWDVKAIKRDHPADIRLQQEDARIVARFRHRKHAAGITAQKLFDAKAAHNPSTCSGRAA